METKTVIEKLRAECEKAGSQRAFARQHGLSAAYVSDVLLGRRDPAEAICKALGLKRVVTFKTTFQPR